MALIVLYRTDARTFLLLNIQNFCMASHVTGRFNTDKFNWFRTWFVFFLLKRRNKDLDTLIPLFLISIPLLTIHSKVDRDQCWMFHPILFHVPRFNIHVSLSMLWIASKICLQLVICHQYLIIFPVQQDKCVYLYCN